MQYRPRYNIFNSFGIALLFMYIYKGRKNIRKYCIFILQRNLHDIIIKGITATCTQSDRICIMDLNPKDELV